LKAPLGSVILYVTCVNTGDIGIASSEHGLELLSKERRTMMTVQIITPADTHFPLSLLTEEPSSIEEDSELAFLPLMCCDYAVYPFSLEPELAVERDRNPPGKG
jgi:hypothetical protein